MPSKNDCQARKIQSGKGAYEQNSNNLNSMHKIAESGEREINHVSKRKSHGVGGYATISDQFDIQEDSAFLAKRSTHLRSKDRDPSVTSYNPLVMRGSLNCGRRKNEMIRINQGNKVSLHRLLACSLLSLL